MFSQGFDTKISQEFHGLICSTLQSTLRSTLTFVQFELRARTWKRMPRVDPVSPISKNFPMLMFLAMTTT